jgi:hypothetical protein
MKNRIGPARIMTTGQRIALIALIYTSVRILNQSRLNGGVVIVSRGGNHEIFAD